MKHGQGIEQHVKYATFMVLKGARYARYTYTSQCAGVCLHMHRHASLCRNIRTHWHQWSFVVRDLGMFWNSVLQGHCHLDTKAAVDYHTFLTRLGLLTFPTAGEGLWGSKSWGRHIGGYTKPVPTWRYLRRYINGYPLLRRENLLLSSVGAHKLPMVL